MAYYNPRDKNHGQAVKLLHELETKQFGELFISDYIFDELITSLKKYIGNKKATEKGTELLNSIGLIKIDDFLFKSSWQLSQKFDSLSFTDCTIVLLMKNYSINYLATFDSDFNGIVTVLR